MDFEKASINGVQKVFRNTQFVDVFFIYRRAFGGGFKI